MPNQIEVQRDAEIRLREITSETVGSICKLSSTLTSPKSNFVANNAFSIAQAYFDKRAWFRAIYADETPVGFIMIVDDPDNAEYFLWRFMIAQPYHGMGFGKRAIDRLVDHVKALPGATELGVSCGQGEGSPEGFYLKYGFKHDGKKHGQEIGLSLKL